MPGEDTFEVDLSTAPAPVKFKLVLEDGSSLEYDPTVLLMKFYRYIRIPEIDPSLDDTQVTALVEKHLKELDPGVFHRAINSLFPEQVEMSLGVCQAVYKKILEAATEDDRRLKKNRFLEQNFAGSTDGNQKTLKTSIQSPSESSTDVSPS